ncbi:hypothetical protein Tco_1368430 [Tanacetum coccineum]
MTVDNQDRRSTSVVSISWKEIGLLAVHETNNRNADFHEVIDFLTGCSVNYALLVFSDVIQQWISTILEYCEVAYELKTSFTLKLRNLQDINPFDVSPVFSGKLTPLTPPMLEVATAVRAEHSLHTEELDIPDIPHIHRRFLQLIKATLSKKKKLKKAHKQKSSSFKQGRMKVSDGSTGLNEVDVNSGDSQMKDVLLDKASGAGITIPGNIPEQERPESPAKILDQKDKGKGIMKEEPKKKKLTLQQLRAAETANKTSCKKSAKNRRENFTIEQKEKFLVETIAAQRRFRAEQQAALKRSKPPTIPQLRNQMMKYIRNVGGKAYRNLKNKSYEEIKDIYEKVKRFNDKFVAIGSTEDEQAIKEMNVKAEEPSKKRKGDSAQDVEVMEQRSLISRFSIIQSPEGEYIVVQRANGHIRAFNTLNEVLHIFWTDKTASLSINGG